MSNLSDEEEAEIRERGRRMLPELSAHYVQLMQREIDDGASLKAMRVLCAGAALSVMVNHLFNANPDKVDIEREAKRLLKEVEKGVEAFLKQRAELEDRVQEVISAMHEKAEETLQ